MPTFPPAAAPLKRRDVLQQAWPIILAGASVPLLGMADTAVMGHYGSIPELAALALGVLLFNFLFWGFGFLRMATTGFVAQAAGTGAPVQLLAAVLRPMLLGLLIGMGLLGLQWPLAAGFLAVMDAGPVVTGSSLEYVQARIWGAPAALALYALCGALIGLGHSRALLVVQLVLNVSNALLDVWLAGVLGLGLAGIGYGTALAEWGSCLLAICLLWRALRGGLAGAGGRAVWGVLADRAAWRRLWQANGNLMVRTLCLLAGFAWFARLGAQSGPATLAANHVLLQLVAFCAFFLDGFAHVAEARVGAAIGRGEGARLRCIVVVCSQVAAISAVLLSLAVWLGAGWLVGVLTPLPAVVQLAPQYLPWVSLYVLLSVAAFQLDGVFIGALRTGAMRSAAVLSLLVFVPLAWLGQSLWGNHGLWAAMVVFVVARALCLWPAWRAMSRECRPA